MLIEDEDEFADRVNGKMIESDIIKVHTMDRETYLKMTFFQYMIANVDWSVSNKHNLSFLQIPGYTRIIPVPYDFDYSGLADTRYAVPASSLPITDVSQRYFMGYFVTEEEALVTAAFFRSKKDQLLKILADFKWLDQKNQESIQTFLLKFFDVMGNEKRLKREFVDKK
jgi:hypothetical protein